MTAFAENEDSKFKIRTNPVSQTSSIHCGHLNHKGRAVVLREPILIPAESFMILNFILFEED